VLPWYRAAAAAAVVMFLVELAFELGFICFGLAL
jgi:hypothetical protein